ncbi:MAG TPA: hypothetical protein VEZ11_09580 [Thermoanaerobaculia bacterium]|nr:hypothetical protein [Thermoanaerobaculia bacterium]
MTSPTYDLAFQSCDGYLRACVSGASDSIEISLAYWREVAAECRRLGYSKLLVCENLGETAPSMHDTSLEYYLVGCEVPAMIMGLRVAFVDAATEESRWNRLGENVAYSRGADARMFLTEEDAIAWLTSSGT